MAGAAKSCLGPGLLALWLTAAGARAGEAPALYDPVPEGPPFAQHVSFSALGGVGLIHTGNARFMGDGEMAAGVNYQDPFGALFLTWQATPWLEATFRYADTFGQPDDLDRALDLKIRLVRERDFLPAIALGLRDALGGGPWSGEYLAFSKRFGPFDATLGFGWGALAARNGVTNPLTKIAGRFDVRDQGRSGVPARGNFFSGGRMGLFAGLEYMTPLRGLSLKAEFDSSDLRDLPLGEPVDKHAPVNVAADYRPLPWLHLSLGLARGDTVNAGFAIRLNPGRLSPARKTDDPSPAAVAPLPPERAPAAPSFRVPPRPPRSHAMDDALTRVSLALTQAGIEAPLFEIADGRAVLTASFPPASAPRQSLKAAYLVFSNLPASFDRLVLYNRLGDAVGAEGQVFTRDLVADFARADAAFDKLIQAGGVNEVTLSGDAVTADFMSGGAAAPLALAALSPAFQAPPPAPEPAAPSPAEEAATVFARAEAQGLRPIGLRLTGDTVALAVENPRYRHSPQAIGRAARALMSGLSGEPERVEVATFADGVEVGRVRFFAEDFARAANLRGSPEEVWLHTEIARGGADFPVRAASHPAFDWAVYPELLQHFGSGAEDGYRAGLYGTVEGRLDLFKGLSITAAASREIYGNLDDIAPRPAGLGPRVRSDIAHYADEGETALTRLRADYTLRPFGDLYLRGSVGLFERMYGGAGVEALFAPRDSAFALGLDVNWVKQRDFDQLLDFRDYETWTGHLSLYHENSRLGLRTVLSIGRYLARDWGATLDISRQFDNGIRLGAWMTVTDYGSAAFGSDSYAKGLYLSIPFDMVLPWSTRRSSLLEARVLNRDGGQRLWTGPGLYSTVRQGHEDVLRRSWRHLLD